MASGEHDRNPTVCISLPAGLCGVCYHPVACLASAQQGERYGWCIGDLCGVAKDVLDALGSAIHCLLMERLEGQP